jgi:hypothetical protein
VGGWPIRKKYRHIGCPIHAVSSHEWAFALRANRFPSDLPVTRTSRQNKMTFI